MPTTPDTRRIRRVSSSYSPDDEVSIIGGGGAGLAAAFFLLKAGHDPKRITVWERESYFGGNARTIYLHAGSEGHLYAIQNYQIRIVDGEPLLVFKDHADELQELSLSKDRSLIPVDVGVCGTSVNYHNFSVLLSGISQSGGAAATRYDYAKDVSFGVEYNGLTLRSDKLLFGQLTRPQNWYPTFQIWWDTKRAVRYCQAKGMEYWRQRTVRELLAELAQQSIPDRVLMSLCAFCQVGSGYSNAQFLEISAAYWLNFFVTGNFHNFGAHTTIFLYGISAYIAGLTTHLTDAGVTLQRGEGRPARHTIHAVQPFDAFAADHGLPEITSSRSIAYVHRDPSLAHSRQLDTVLGYGTINGIAQASWDVDAMRPNHPDVGAFVTFTIPDHEAEVDTRLFGPKPATVLGSAAGNGHDLRASAFKVVWKHAFIDVPAEAARRRIWTEHQGRNDAYYCGSSYQDCILHESAVTSALDVVCLLTGKEVELSGLGFKPSDHARDASDTAAPRAAPPALPR